MYLGMSFSGIFHLMTLIFILINVAFVTLLERKILGFSQIRKGPNKVSLFGILQPISDAMKLFAKENVVPFKSNILLFLTMPIFSISLSLILWSFMEFSEKVHSLWISSIAFLMFVGFGVYPLLFMGWSSNSKYALLGAIRAVAQTVSYEISLALILLVFLTISMSLSFSVLCSLNTILKIFLVIPVMGMFWLISCLAETNRTPFDFAEGESELVSGFNVEYGGSGFTLIFMSEYSMILLFSFLSCSVFFISSVSSVFSFFGMVLLSSVWVWIRSTYPRYRYDKLMNLAWKSILPSSLMYLMWVCSILCL